MRALILVAFLGVGAHAAAATLVDAVLAEVENRTLTATDVALARALGLFGARPTAAVIDGEEVERFIGTWVIVLEARRLGIAPSAEDVERAWQAAEARAGGPGALDAWVAAMTVGHAWPRRLVEDHARWDRFIELRFRAFAFVTEDQVSAELGPGDHPPAARDAVRDRLIEEETAERLREWLADVVAGASIRRLLTPGTALANPLPMPTSSGSSPAGSDPARRR